MNATRTLMLGILWGIAVASMEAVALPIADESWSSFIRLLVWNAVTWVVVGVCLAWVLRRARWRIERPWFLAFSIAAVAPLLSAVATLMFSFEGGPGLGLEIVFPGGRDPLASFLYQAWLVTFYGGLFALAWAFNQRGERIRSLLGRAQVARLQSETQLAEAQIQALRGYVDHGFLLHVMRSIERRYRDGSGDADQLLNRLIVFLRLAMPAVRSGSPTVAVEPALARAHAELAAEVGYPSSKRE